MAIKAVLLDLGNVMVRLKDREFLRRLKRACPDMDLQEFDMVLSKPDSPHLDYESGRIGARQFYERLVADLGLVWGYQEFLDNWTAFFTPNRPMELVAQSLKPFPTPTPSIFRSTSSASPRPACLMAMWSRTKRACASRIPRSSNWRSSAWK
jgi:hypothetical protein